MSDPDKKNNSLASQHCTAAALPLSHEKIGKLLQQLDGWAQQGQTISRSFDFKNYYQTISFVNALAWVANQQDHHPELSVGYKHCKVEYTTHSINGLSENDFICAARIDALLTA